MCNDFSNNPVKHENVPFNKANDHAASDGCHHVLSSKLDWVSPLMTDPPPNSSTIFPKKNRKKKKKTKKKYVYMK